jgi:hypothetical protein
LADEIYRRGKLDESEVRAVLGKRAASVELNQAARITRPI